MGLFDKFLGKSGSPANKAASQQPCKTEEELLERFGGIALEKQLDLGEVIGSNKWNADMRQGVISFGPDLVFPVQVLGTFSHSSESWLWAWANKQSGLSENLIQQSLQLKKYGDDNGIDLLRNESFDFSKEELHIIGAIASGMFDSSGYYIADYGQGAMVVTVKSSIVDKARNDNHQRIFTIFPQLISQFAMNHKNTFKEYLTAKGYTISESGNSVTGTKNGNTATGEFDELSRLTKLNG